ncbi:MAG: hypothetical protein M3261_05310 [Thermoproteota archaeon]|nr:hypothetical protein [Thermoproteota archaeon]
MTGYRVSTTIGSIATTCGVFNEIERNLDTNFGSTILWLRDTASYYRVVSWYTRTKVLFPDSKPASDSPNACRNFPLFLIKFENILPAASYPLITSNVSVG